MVSVNSYMIKLCLKCQHEIPKQIIINNKVHSLQRRSYCLDCSPFGLRNTRKLHLSDSPQLHARHYTNMTDEQRKEYNTKSYKYQKQQRNKRKIELVLLKGGKCECCGYNKNLSVLQFHHINPKEKLFCLTTRELFAKSMDVLINEANKCQLLCANCHAEHHNPDGNNWQNKEPIKIN